MRALKCSGFFFVMESSFSFANVEFIKVPLTSFIDDFGPLRLVQAIFVWKKGFDAACDFRCAVRFLLPQRVSLKRTSEAAL